MWYEMSESWDQLTFCVGGKLIINISRIKVNEQTNTNVMIGDYQKRQKELNQQTDRKTLIKEKCVKIYICKVVSNIIHTTINR